MEPVWEVGSDGEVEGVAEVVEGEVAGVEAPSAESLPEEEPAPPHPAMAATTAVIATAGSHRRVIRLVLDNDIDLPRRTA